MNPNVYLCAGISPQEAMRYPDIKIKLPMWEEKIQNFGKLVAIGEIGLDYSWAKTEEERFRQHECFISQLALAEKLNLPVVIHSREAEKECIEILANFNLPFMLHCFSGKKELAIKACQKNGIISIPPIKNKDRKKIIKSLDISSLVAESDVPYIGKTPESVQESINNIARIKGLEIDIVRLRLLQNTVFFFKIN